ncbi:MAG: hypothetical protein QOE03_3635, partial [Micromonosporaceae bacterium]|nr:hypothetical protein [Micromonosporaceae bacterium]
WAFRRWVFPHENARSGRRVQPDPVDAAVAADRVPT